MHAPSHEEHRQRDENDCRLQNGLVTLIVHVQLVLERVFVQVAVQGGIVQLLTLTLIPSIRIVRHGDGIVVSSSVYVCWSHSARWRMWRRRIRFLLLVLLLLRMLVLNKKAQLMINATAAAAAADTW